MATTPRNQPGHPEVDKDQHPQPKPNDETIPQAADKPGEGEDDGEGEGDPPGGNNPVKPPIIP